ncbi:MAG: heparinase II/III family protein [Clostridia bacterium]|nr:heparinase II/III family protein [Clostridia bacterium]
MNILGRVMDKDFWQSVRADEKFEGLRAVLLRDFDTFTEEGDLPALKYSEWKMFFVSGERSTYQRSFLRYRHALSVSALLSLIYPEEEKYLDFLMDAIYIICSTYTWSYPAHQGGNFTDNNNSIIDLTAARVAMDLADVYTLLEDRLDPLIKSRILAEIDRRTFTPFESNMPCFWWENGHSNWVAVCMGAVAKTYMLLRPEKAREYLPRFNRGIDNYITSFSEEGICFEGGGYWMFGFGAFVGYARALRIFTDGEIDYFSIPKVRHMSLFYQRIFLSGRATANFADSEIYGVPGALSRLLKPEFPEINVKKVGFGSPREFDAELLNILSISEVDELDEDVGDNYDSEFYAPSAHWYIKHTPSFGFAAKGGHNKELHNHNDVGHFIYAKNGKQILCDIGVGIYTASYFSSERYENLEPSSRCHSVPIIDGELQKPGKEFAARDFKYENGVLTLDISRAYGIFDEDERIDRRFDINDGGFKLTDSFTFNKERSVTERIMTRIEPNLSTNGLIVIDGTEIKYDPSRWTAFVSGSEPSARDRIPCYFIDFTPIGEISDFVLTVDKY